MGAAVSGIGGTIGFKYFHSSTTSDPDHMATLVRLRRPRHRCSCADVDGLAAAMRDPPKQRELIEGVVALVLLVVVSGLANSIPRETWTTVVPAALLFPVLLWLAARCRPVFASMAAFVVAFTIFWTTTFGIGQSGDQNLSIENRILAAQSTILAVSLCAYVLAALFAERRESEAALTEREARLQEALAAGAVTAFEWDFPTRSSRRSENAAQILGFDPEQVFTARQFLAQVHPEDRPRFKALVYGVRPDSPSYAVTFRFKRPDGREVWLQEASRAEFDATGRYLRLKGLSLTSQSASVRKSTKTCWLQNSITGSRTCLRALLWLRCTPARAATLWMNSSKHWTGAFNPWPTHTRC